MDFLIGFLPAVWLLFLLLRSMSGANTTLMMLVAASWWFYAAWYPLYLPLLIGSIAVNYWIGTRIALAGSRVWLVSGVVFNLSLLGVFKYLGFITTDIFQLKSPVNVALPLAISFYTFQQIAWLADLRQNKTAVPGIIRYTFFVSFFPQLIAGPIVHARQVVPQIAADWLKRPIPVALALTFLSVGLAKKVLIADTLAPGVDLIYGNVAATNFDMWQVWSAAAGYGAQLYFDFSGYADMAIGLALLFGIRLPFNFLSPYKAVSIIDFWRRWHITLSKFLRDYLYIPLGGSRKGRLRRYANLMITMLLGGLWHGAGWQFLLWGGIHGGLLTLNHLWRAVTPIRLPLFLAWALTLIAVLLAWIPFRADNLTDALHIFSGLGRVPILEGGFPTTEIVGALMNLDASGQLGWLAILAILFALLAPSTHVLASSLTPLQKGLLSAPLLLMVFKTIAERPDRVFLYFNF